MKPIAYHNRETGTIMVHKGALIVAAVLFALSVPAGVLAALAVATL